MVNINSILGGMAGGATVAIVIKAIDEFSSVFEGVNKSMLATGTAITAFGATGAVVLGSLAIEAGKATGRIDAFNNMFGKEAPRALEKLREATKGTVSDIDLITQANQALLLGLDVNALPTMFEGAFSAAQATGRPVANAIADITLGIGRQSRLILDNLGIIVKQEEANKAYALSLGKTVEELTQAETKTAFMNATMDALRVNQERIGTVQDSLTIKTQRMGAEFQNIKLTVGELLIPVLTKLVSIGQVVVGFFSQHPVLAKWVVISGAVASALALVVGPILILVATLPALIAGFGTLSAVTLPITATILEIGLAVGIVVAAIFGLIKLINLIPGVNIPIPKLSDLNPLSGIQEQTELNSMRNARLARRNESSGNININIEKVMGVDEQDISEAMATEVNRQIHAV